MGADWSTTSQPVPTEEPLSFDDIHKVKQDNIPVVVLRPARPTRAVTKRRAIVAHKPINSNSVFAKYCKPLFGSSEKGVAKTDQQGKLIGEKHFLV